MTPLTPFEKALQLLAKLAQLVQTGLTIVAPIVVMVVIGLIAIATMREDIGRLFSKDPAKKIGFWDLIHNHLRFFYIAGAFLGISGCVLASSILIIFAQGWATGSGQFMFSP